MSEVRQIIDEALRQYVRAFEAQSHGTPAFSAFAVEALTPKLRASVRHEEEVTAAFQALRLGGGSR